MRNYLHQRSKSLLAFAVGLTILSSSFAGEAEAATREEFYYQGSDLATDDGATTWDNKNKTATLHADRSIYRSFEWSYDTFGINSHADSNGLSYAQFASLGTTKYFNSHSYTVDGEVEVKFDGEKETKNPKFKLTLFGDIIASLTKNLTVKNLSELNITNGTYGLDSNYGNDNTEGGLYLDNITKVNISGTVSAIYGDTRGKIELNNIGTLNLASNINRVSEYRGLLPATEDNTITCGYGSIVNINAKDTTITSTGRAILATAHNIDKINEYEDGNWETNTPWPQVNINSETLTIAAATSGPTAAAVYSDTGAIVNLGSADKKIQQLTFVKDAGTNMNLYSSSYIYKLEKTGTYDRYSDTIPTVNYKQENLHQSQINVYAENAEFNANTNAINARNNALINVNADNAVINSNYGNVATVSSSGGSTVTLTGDDLAITNHNTNYLKDANVVAAKKAKVAIGSGGIVNPSRQDLVEDYGGTVDNAGNLIINANKKLTVNGNIIIDAKSATAAGNSININKDNTTALVNITGDIYTNKGNEVNLSLGDGSAAGQNGSTAGRQAGRSTLTGAILDAASTAANFSFSNTSFSEKGTNLKMNSATWNVTADSDVAKVEMTGSSIIDLTQRNEATTVDMAGSSTRDHSFQKLKINNLTGSGIIKMDYDDSKTSTDGSTADKLFINNHSGTHCLYLNEVNGAATLTGSAEDTVLVSVVNETGNFQAASDDNLTWNIYALNKKDSTTEGYTTDWYLAKNTNPTPAPQGPTRAEAGTLKAHNMSYYLWRDQSERLTKRLGITCFDEERAGVWTKTPRSKPKPSAMTSSIIRTNA